MATAVICGILIVLCFVAVRKYVKQLKNGCCGGQADAVKRKKAKDTDVSHYPYSCTIEVKGMTCSNCKKRVENTFHEQPGFFAEVDLKKGIVKIYMKEQREESELKQMIWKSGYEPGATI